MARALLIVLVVVVTVLGASIGYFNAQPVRFNYLVGEAQLPLVALIVVELLVVAVATALLCAGRMLTLSSEIRRLRRRLRETEAELKNLRNLPLKDV